MEQDDDLLRRDYAGATESSVDMTLLPKVMQVRDFGKASRTKYTHLADQDTSQGGWGAALRRPPGAQTTGEGCWNCGGPHLRKGQSWLTCVIYVRGVQVADVLVSVCRLSQQQCQRPESHWRDGYPRCGWCWCRCERRKHFGTWVRVEDLGEWT